MSGPKNFELLIPNTMPQSVGYSQLATVTGGTLVFISGQVALDKSGNAVGKNDFRAQVQQVFENLNAAIESAGGTFDDVVKFLLQFALTLPDSFHRIAPSINPGPSVDGLMSATQPARFSL